jgi:hypothetical protein
MDDVRVCRNIATTNVVCGGFAFIGVLFAIGAMIAADTYALVPILLVTVMGFVSGGIIHSGARHLRSPSRKLALTNAANSSIVIWLFLAWLLRDSGIRESFGPAYVLLPLFGAFVAYRLFLRPVAQRGFPDDAQNAKPQI